VRTPWIAQSVACSEASSATNAGIWCTGTSDARVGFATSAATDASSGPTRPTGAPSGRVTSGRGALFVRRIGDPQSGLEAAPAAVWRMAQEPHAVFLVKDSR